MPRRTLQPRNQKKSAIKPKRETLSRLPQIVFDVVSKEFDISTECKLELYWPLISIFRTEGLVNLQLPVQVQLRRIHLPCRQLVWIGWAKGYNTNTFILALGEPGMKWVGNSFIVGPKPIIIIEAGHPIPSDSGTVMLDEQYECLKICRSLPRGAQGLYDRISALMEANIKRLPRRRKRNPLTEGICI